MDDNGGRAGVQRRLRDAIPAKPNNDYGGYRRHLFFVVHQDPAQAGDEGSPIAD
jgi:hypothetical protein